MKVLLINPGFHYSNPFLQVTKPLGILYLAAHARANSSHELGILDCRDAKEITQLAPEKYWYGISIDETLRQVEERGPDVVGISCLFSRKKDDFFAVARAIVERFPDKIMVAGGTYPSLSPEDVISSGLFHYCVIGEAEDTFLKLLNAIDAGAPPDSIDGIAFKKEDGTMVKNPKTTFIENLDSIPFPARDLINYDGYLTRKSVLHGLGLKRVASILTSRSCPNRCNFCSMFEVHGPRWRARSPENVVAEIIELKEKFGVQEFFVMDDNFTFKKKRVLRFCEELEKSGLKIKWNTPNGIAIKTLDREVLVAMKKAGCASICIAIETGDEELRNKVIGKRLSDEKIEEVARAASDIGLFTTAFYIIGMPGETDESFEKTIEQIRSIPLNGVAAAFANPLPVTQLYDECNKNNWNILQSDEHNDNIFYKPYITTEDFSEEKLIEREKRFYRTFIKARFLTIIKDTLLMRNGLLYPPFLLRIIKDRLLRV